MLDELIKTFKGKNVLVTVQPDFKRSCQESFNGEIPQGPWEVCCKNGQLREKRNLQNRKRWVIRTLFSQFFPKIKGRCLNSCLHTKST